jgi:hypothetical protein
MPGARRNRPKHDNGQLVRPVLGFHQVVPAGVVDGGQEEPASFWWMPLLAGCASVRSAAAETAG